MLMIVKNVHIGFFVKKIINNILILIGDIVARRCPRCGETVESGEIICEYCGADLGLDSDYSWKYDISDELENDDDYFY